MRENIFFMKDSFQIIAKTSKGFEEILAKELINLGADEVQLEHRAVSCKGDKAFLYKANLYCRTASRLLVPIEKFNAKNADEVYNQVKKIDWEKYMDLNTTFAIDSTVFSELFTHSKFVSYRVKDAIADQFMEKYEKRPSVSISSPDLRINVYISPKQCVISLDSSGDSLHKRGYRASQTEAPMNESLAAGLLMTAGWDGKMNFIDPMCGSGTLLIEAALIALNIPPGIFRKSFGFEKWRDFDKELFDELYNDDSYERDFDFKIYGSDVSPQAIKIADQNVRSAGLSKYIELKTVGINDIEMPEGECLMVTNPPYGERLQSEDLFGLYENIGRMLKFKFAGNQAWVISSDERCLFKIGLKPSKKIPLLNGDLDCFYCNYEIFAGKRDEYVRAKKEGE